MVKKAILELIELRNYLNIEEEVTQNYLNDLESDYKKVKSKDATKYLERLIIREKSRLGGIKKFKGEVTQRINKLEMSKND